MQRYEKYKDSGVDWIGEIPEGWEIRRIKTLFKEINERSFEGLEDLLSVSQYTGVTKKSDRVEEGDLLTNASTLEGYKIVRKNDLVSNIMLAWNGSLGFSPFDGITSPAYSVYRLKDIGEKQFFHYLFRTEKYKAEFKRQSSGVIESRLRLYSDDFFGIFSILPPTNEQQTIANFLDDKTAKIDKTITIKQKEIELLKERRQILIQQAVTKGLDATVPMKDSGVDWIGEIPEHWEVEKFKNRIKLRHGYQFRDYDFVEEGIKIVKITQLSSDGHLDLSKANFISTNRLKHFQDILIKKDDILMCLTGGTIGKIIRVNEVGEPLLQNYRVGHFSSLNKKNLTNDYVFTLLRSNLLYKQIINDMSETGQPNIGMEDMKKMIIVVPPIAEQIQIVSYLEDIEAKIAKAITLKEQEIEKLKEYKTVLIDNVVTGKVRVSKIN